MNRFTEGAVWENDSVTLLITEQWTQDYPRQIMFEVQVMSFNAEGDVDDYDETTFTFSELAAFVHEREMIYREDNYETEEYYDD